MNNGNRCIIVDSTRRGKAMPDALSKTVPIWCAVLNRLLFGHIKIFLPEEVIGSSESAQILRKIDGWVRAIKVRFSMSKNKAQLIPQVLQLDITELRKKLAKPLRTFWITPDILEAPDLANLAPYYPVVCCTASRRVRGSEASEDGYIQGAADDSESWAQGITPSLFWEHKDILLSEAEEHLPALIRKLKAETPTALQHKATLIRPTEGVFIGTLDVADPALFDGIVVCNDAADEKHCGERDEKTKRVLRLNCGIGKLGSRALRTQLSRVPPFVGGLIPGIEGKKLLFACSTGKNLSAGVALTILCMYYNNDG